MTETAESLNPGLLLPRFCTCFFTSLFMWAFTVVLFHVSLTRRYSSGLNTRCLEWAQWRSCIKFVWKCCLSCCTLWWLFMLLLVFWIYIYIAVYMKATPHSGPFHIKICLDRRFLFLGRSVTGFHWQEESKLCTRRAAKRRVKHHERLAQPRKRNRVHKWPN
jgi:hypothetical protein